MSPLGWIPQGTNLARSNRVYFRHEVVCRCAERKEGEMKERKRRREQDPPIVLISVRSLKKALLVETNNWIWPR